MKNIFLETYDYLNETNQIIIPSVSWIQQIFKKNYNKHLLDIKNKLKEPNNPLFKYFQ